ALLRLEGQWLHACPGQRLVAGDAVPLERHLALPDERQREVGERCEVPGRTERSLLGHHGQQVPVEELHQPLHDQRSHARATASTCARSSIMARTSHSLKYGPTPTACERRRSCWRRRTSSGARRTLARLPRPVETP